MDVYDVLHTHIGVVFLQCGCRSLSVGSYYMQTSSDSIYSHWCGFFPVWMRLCAHRLLLLANLWFFSSVDAVCVHRLLPFVNFLWQTLVHTGLASVQWNCGKTEMIVHFGMVSVSHYYWYPIFSSSSDVLSPLTSMSVFLTVAAMGRGLCCTDVNLVNHKHRSCFLLLILNS